MLNRLKIENVKALPLWVSCGCDPVHTEKECDYYFNAITKKGYTKHDILMARRSLKMAIEANERRCEGR